MKYDSEADPNRLESAMKAAGRSASQMESFVKLPILCIDSWNLVVEAADPSNNEMGLW